MKISQSSKVCRAILGAALFAGFGFVTHVSAQERYFLVDLNSKTVTGLSNLFGGKSTFPRGINDVAQVVGWSFDRVTYAFITGPGGAGTRDLDALGEPYNTSAEDINDAGQVVGWSETAEGASHAFITDPDGVGMRDLGALGGYSMAQAR